MIWKADQANSLAGQVNERRELQFGPDYVNVDEDSFITDHIFMDPIDGGVDARYLATVTEFKDNTNFSALTLTSATEMRLILAEAALASGDLATFTTEINTVRAGLGQFDGDMAAAMDLLKHERRANLFLQYKRLQDMYRFGEVSATWLAGSKAMTTPGTMLPITLIEIRSNPNIS